MITEETKIPDEVIFTLKEVIEGQPVYMSMEEEIANSGCRLVYSNSYKKLNDGLMEKTQRVLERK